MIHPVINTTKGDETGDVVMIPYSFFESDKQGFALDLYMSQAVVGILNRTHIFLANSMAQTLAMSVFRIQLSQHSLGRTRA